MATLKLNKSDSKRLFDARDALTSAIDDYETARDAFEVAARAAAVEHLRVNDLRPLWGAPAVLLSREIVELYGATLATAQADCEAAADTLESLAQELAREQQEIWDGRSERWQESDDGQASSEWIEHLAAVESPCPYQAPCAQEIAAALALEGDAETVLADAVAAFVVTDWADTVRDEAESIEAAPEC